MNALSPLKLVSLIDDFLGACSVIQCDTGQSSNVLTSVNSYKNQKGEISYFWYFALFLLIFMRIDVVEILLHLDQ